MNQIPNIPNIQEYHQHFDQTAPLIKHEPRTDRGCNDKCCYVVFLLLTLLLIGGGIFFMVKADFGSLGTRFANTNSTNTTATIGGKEQTQTYDISNLKPGIPVIVGMIVFSLILSILYLCLIVKCPKCMFYAMLVLGALLVLALSIVLFIAGSIAGGAIFLAIFVLYLVMVYCSREKIRIGIVLLETAAKFVAEKPSVFLAPFAIFIVVALFQIFWLASFVAISLYETPGAQQDPEQLDQVATIFIIIWSFLQLFYSFFFFYCTVFVIATAAAMWYYNVDGNYLCTALKRIIANHLGSFTFAAMIMAIVTVARQSAQRQSQEGSGGAAICYCLIACFLKAIEDLLEVLNHNAIIVMAVTGQSYIDSAKSAISLIFDNFLLFFLIDMVSSMVKLSGIIFICAVPGIIGFFLLRAMSQNPDDTNFMTFGTCIIVLIAMLIGGIFLSVLSQALSCVFIFFCLDKRFMKMGYPAPQNTPAPMRKLFQEMGNTYHSEIANSPYASVPRA